MKIIVTSFLCVITLCLHAQGISGYEAQEKKTKAAEAEMKKAFASLCTGLTAVEKKLVITDQSAWLKYRDTQLNLYAYQNRDGSGSGTFALEEKERLIRKRTAYLRELKNYFEEDKKARSDPSKF